MHEEHWIEELKALAEKATRGPWAAEGMMEGYLIRSTYADEPVADCEFREDQAYIAAASPDKILQLLSLLHEVSTEADPAGTLRELRLAQETCKALEIENAELKANREDAVDLLARYFHDQKNDQWLDDDEAINVIRKIGTDVYRQHRVRDFTAARIESCRAVIKEVLSGVSRLKEERK